MNEKRKLKEQAPAYESKRFCRNSFAVKKHVCSNVSGVNARCFLRDLRVARLLVTSARSH